ncbi:hypothetical protein EXD76_00850 [BEV proteobacterium]|nr:hypothetical protein [Candidatus Symbiopectobacterium sp. Chty_BC]
MWGTVVTSSDLFNKASTKPYFLPKLAWQNSMITCYSTKPRLSSLSISACICNAMRCSSDGSSLNAGVGQSRPESVVNQTPLTLSGIAGETWTGALTTAGGIIFPLLLHPSTPHTKHSRKITSIVQHV